MVLVSVPNILRFPRVLYKCLALDWTVMFWQVISWVIDWIQNPKINFCFSHLAETLFWNRIDFWNENLAKHPNAKSCVISHTHKSQMLFYTKLMKFCTTLICYSNIWNYLFKEIHYCWENVIKVFDKLRRPCNENFVTDLQQHVKCDRP